ncbi:MAG: CPBP family intramembrane metalloprotease [Candidatus Thorarchaeota archaeon]|nr:CPBP family intramembrane metalloprotease [Candidatus Thorarchaeota archaeon]
MVQTTVQEHPSSVKDEHSFWSSLSLLTVSGIMLTIGIVWRVVDQFVLGLGDTWINIMPSKLFPFLIIIGFFWRYRRPEIETALGLSRNQMRVQLAVGLVMGLLISGLIDIGSTVVYGLLLDPSYPLELHILNPQLLGYTLLFFLTNAFLEETLFRGLLQNGLKTRFSANVAIVLSAIAFGFWHAGWPLLNGGPNVAREVSMMVFFTTILGLLFGVYYERFSSGRSLTGVIVAHTIFNFVNENFKIGPEPSMQGPDMAFLTPGLLGVTLVMFLLVFSTLFLVFTRYKIEQVSSLWNRITKRTRDLQNCPA